MNKPQVSYWESVFLPEQSDIIIIGAGIVGLTCAIALAQKSDKLKILVLERLPISRGASTRNAGFACFGSPSELLEDLKNRSEEEVFRTVQDRYRGLEKLLSLVGKQTIDFEQSNGQEIFFELSQFEAYADQLDYLNSHLVSLLNIDPVYSIKKRNSSGLYSDHWAINIAGEGMIHPGKMVAQLENLCQGYGINVIKGVDVQHVQQLDDQVAIHLSNNHLLFGKYCCICTNGFAGAFYPELDLKPVRNQVLLSKPIPHIPIYGTYHHDAGYVYWRNVGDRLLIGGMRNLEPEKETTDQFGRTDQIMEALKHFVSDKILPGAVEYEYAWSGILGVGQSKKPIIQKMSDNIVVAVRLGGMGVAIGTLVGYQAAELTID